MSEVTYILNRRSKMLHTMIGGKSAESDNLDAISPANRMSSPEGSVAARAWVMNHKVRACKRCFPDGKPELSTIPFSDGTGS